MGRAQPGGMTEPEAPPTPILFIALAVWQYTLMSVALIMVMVVFMLS